MHPRPSPERRFLDVLQLHEAAGDAFSKQRYEEAVSLFEVLASLGKLTPEEREQWKLAQLKLHHEPSVEDEAERLLSRHQRDRDDEDDQRFLRRRTR